jgi:hypothetical protein
MCEIINVYAAVIAMMCVVPAYLLAINSHPKDHFGTVIAVAYHRGRSSESSRFPMTRLGTI